MITREQFGDWRDDAKAQTALCEQGGYPLQSSFFCFYFYCADVIRLLIAYSTIKILNNLNLRFFPCVNKQF
jgi:hypothetical protein